MSRTIPVKSEYDQDSVAGILVSAFDILGGKNMKQLFEHLMQKYDIDMDSATKSDVGQIHRAIAELFGPDAAQLLMKRVYLQLDGI